MRRGGRKGGREGGVFVERNGRKWDFCQSKHSAIRLGSKPSESLILLKQSKAGIMRARKDLVEGCLLANRRKGGCKGVGDPF